MKDNGDWQMVTSENSGLPGWFRLDLLAREARRARRPGPGSLRRGPAGPVVVPVQGGGAGVCG